MDEYFKGNKAYWDKGYVAQNVESFVFRPFGRIFAHDCGLTGKNHEKMLDFGCGQGAALQFYDSNGFDVYGVDISEPDIGVCKKRMPHVADHFITVDPKPKAGDMWFGGGFDLVIAIQALYYFNNEDYAIRIKTIYDMMKPGAYIYASMMGTKAWYYEKSTPYKDGLRRVEIDTPRLKLKDYYIFFVESEKELLERFKLWKPVHVGYYDAKYRNDEGCDFHYTFIGQKV